MLILQTYKVCGIWMVKKSTILTVLHFLASILYSLSRKQKQTAEFHGRKNGIGWLKKSIINCPDTAFERS